MKEGTSVGIIYILQAGVDFSHILPKFFRNFVRKIVRNYFLKSFPPKISLLLINIGVYVNTLKTPRKIGSWVTT
jgi:hypothetical protein